MTAPTIVYAHSPKAAYDALLATGTLKVMYLHDTYVLDQGNHAFVSDIVADEASGTGYTAGGIALDTPTVTVDPATKTMKLDADNVTGIEVTCCYEVVILDTGTDATSPVLSLTDLSEGTGVDVVSTGTNWSDAGIFTGTV
jgi:hypothetical protein